MAQITMSAVVGATNVTASTTLSDADAQRILTAMRGIYNQPNATPQQIWTMICTSAFAALKTNTRTWENGQQQPTIADIPLT